jgi:hypothetical protein
MMVQVTPETSPVSDKKKDRKIHSLPPISTELLDEVDKPPKTPPNSKKKKARSHLKIVK